MAKKTLDGSRHLDEENELSEEQLKELDEAIAEADRGETISWEEFKQNMDELRTKLKSTV